MFGEAQALMRRGENVAAIGRLKDALSIQRNNRDYQRSLAQAQLAAGQAEEAEQSLAELLQGDSTDAQANLLMARTLVKQQRLAEAISYFHRAVYGRWSEDSEENRLKVRIELVDLLARLDSKQELLAELLALQAESQGNPGIRMQMGRLFLRAGSPVRAAETFREILRADPANAAAYAGLGNAEFQRANYRAAQRAFLSALRLAPSDQATRESLAVCDRILELDPTIRGLGLKERLRRSRKLVEMTLDAVAHCGVSPLDPQWEALIENARKAVKERVRPASEVDVSESNLDLAEELWQVRMKRCKDAPVGNDPLALVISRLTQ